VCIYYCRNYYKAGIVCERRVARRRRARARRSVRVNPIPNPMADPNPNQAPYFGTLVDFSW
jgi:hypothetical protein